MLYKLLGKSGLRVSELCLGTMTFGTEWGTGADWAESKRIFDAYVEKGGNFIDTANRYTEGTSEKWIGEFIASQRDYFVLATKYTLYDDRKNPNASGNHRKNLKRSVEQSLRRLNTDYIDLLWLHVWDFTTSIEEVMQSLNDLVRSGKVLYIGISDSPAWVVSSANTMAELRGWESFIGLQIEYSLIQRTPERDLIPMAKHFGLAVLAWSPLGAGVLTGKYNQGVPADVRLTENSRKLIPQNIKIAQKVSEIAQMLGYTPTQVALNWLRSQHQQFFPIIGARKLSQIEDSLGCLRFQLPSEMLKELSEMSAVEMGFPHDFIAYPTVQDVIFGDYAGKIQNHRLK
ncbi:aldo/keto reductase [Raineya sp.]|jgi:aryl-alcohol dehydrogenase-like predicted oxidoreductase